MSSLGLPELSLSDCSKISIHKLIISISGKSIQHLINERMREMILPYAFVELLIVNSHPLTSPCMGGDKLILLILLLLDHSHSPFLGHNMMGLTQGP